MRMTENVKLLAMKLLDRFGEHVSAQLLLWFYYNDRSSSLYFDLRRRDIRFTALHAVSFLRIPEIVATGLEKKAGDVNATDGMGSTALTWAAREGHEEVVKMLLELENVNPD